MTTYHVSGYITVGCFATVEADSEEEAKEKVESMGVPSFCYQCSSAGEGTEESGEVKLDGPDDEITILSARKK